MSATNLPSGADGSLYRAALKADQELTEALVAAYGSKFATEKRYAARHTHTASIVLNALDRKQEADDKWLAEMRRCNRIQSSAGERTSG